MKYFLGWSILSAVVGYQMVKGKTKSIFITKSFRWLLYFQLFSVWAQLLDRSQQRLVLVVIPASLFVPTMSENSMDYDGTDPSDTIKILIDETSDIWINVR